MFSVVVAGRLPLPAPQQIDETHAIFPLEDAASINHVVVFMTGQQAFPQGYAATVHLNWKSTTTSEDKWLMLGCLKNEKPSAIFRIKGLTQQQNTSSTGAGDFGGASTLASAAKTAAIGISIEPVDVVDQQMAALASRNSASGTGASGADVDGMQTEGEGSSSMALVKPSTLGQGDVNAQLSMALALAPKIGMSSICARARRDKQCADTSRIHSFMKRPTSSHTFHLLRLTVHRRQYRCSNGGWNSSSENSKYKA